MSSSKSSRWLILLLAVIFVLLLLTATRAARAQATIRLDNTTALSFQHQFPNDAQGSYTVDGYARPGINIVISNFECAELTIDLVLFPGATVTVQNVTVHELGIRFVWRALPQQVCSDQAATAAVPLNPTDFGLYAAANRVTINVINNKVYGVASTLAVLSRYAGIWISAPGTCGVKSQTATLNGESPPYGTHTSLIINVLGNVIDLDPAKFKTLGITTKVVGILMLGELDELDETRWLYTARPRQIFVSHNTIVIPLPPGRPTGGADVAGINIGIDKPGFNYPLRFGLGDMEALSNQVMTILTQAVLNPSIAELQQPLNDFIQAKPSMLFLPPRIELIGNNVSISWRDEVRAVQILLFGNPDTAMKPLFDNFNVKLAALRSAISSSSSLSSSDRNKMLAQINNNILPAASLTRTFSRNTFNCNGTFSVRAVEFFVPVAFVKSEVIFSDGNVMTAGQLLPINFQKHTANGTRGTVETVWFWQLTQGPAVAQTTFTLQDSTFTAHCGPGIDDSDNDKTDAIRFTCNSTGAVLIRRCRFHIERDLLLDRVTGAQDQFDNNAAINFRSFTPHNDYYREHYHSITVIDNIFSCLVAGLAAMVRMDYVASSSVLLRGNRMVEGMSRAVDRIYFGRSARSNLGTVVVEQNVGHFDGEDCIFFGCFTDSDTHESRWGSVLFKENVGTYFARQRDTTIPDKTRVLGLAIRYTRVDFAHAVGNRILALRGGNHEFVHSAMATRILVESNYVEGRSMIEMLALYTMSCRKFGVFSLARSIELRGNTLAGGGTTVIVVVISHAWGRGAESDGMKTVPATISLIDNFVPAVATLNVEYRPGGDFVIPGLTPQDFVRSTLVSIAAMGFNSLYFRNNTFVRFTRFLLAGGAHIGALTSDRRCSTFNGMSMNNVANQRNAADPLPEAVRWFFELHGNFKIGKYNGTCEFSPTKTKSQPLTESDEITPSDPITITANITATREPTATRIPRDGEPGVELSPSLAAASATSTSFAAIGSLFASPTVALDAGRALSLLATVSRCKQFQEAVEQQQENAAAKSSLSSNAAKSAAASANLATLKRRYAKLYMNRDLAFPESLLFGAKVNVAADGASMRGCILGGFIALLLVGIVGFATGVFLAYKERLKQWKQRINNNIDGGGGREAPLLEDRRSNPPSSSEDASSDNSDRNSNSKGTCRAEFDEHGNLKTPSLTQLVSFREAVSFARFPLIFTMAVALLLGTWLTNAFAFLVADVGVSSGDKFWYGILPVFGCWLLPAFFFSLYLQHAHLSRAFEDSRKDNNNGNSSNNSIDSADREQRPLLSCIFCTEDPMPRRDAMQIEPIYFWFGAQRRAMHDVDGTVSVSSMRMMGFVERLFSSKDGFGRWFSGDFVWSQGSTRTSVAMGTPGSFLRQCGSVLNKFHGPLSRDAAMVIATAKAEAEAAKTPDDDGSHQKKPRQSALVRELYDARDPQPWRNRISPFYVYINSVFCASAGLAQTIAALQPDRCDDVMIVMTVISAIALLFSAVMRPALSPLRNAIQAVADLFVLIACVLAVFVLKSEVAGGLLLTSVALTMVGSVVQASMKLLIFFDVLKPVTRAERNLLKMKDDEEERKFEEMTSMSARERQRRRDAGGPRHHQQHQQQRHRSNSGGHRSGNKNSDHRDSRNGGRFSPPQSDRHDQLLHHHRHFNVNARDLFAMAPPRSSPVAQPRGHHQFDSSLLIRSPPQQQQQWSQRQSPVLKSVAPHLQLKISSGTSPTNNNNVAAASGAGGFVLNSLDSAEGRARISNGNRSMLLVSAAAGAPVTNSFDSAGSGGGKQQGGSGSNNKQNLYRPKATVPIRYADI